MLNISNLLGVAKGDALYWRLPGFLDGDACRAVSARLLANESVRQALNTTGLTYSQLLTLVGLPIPEKESSPAKGLSYYETRYDSAAGWGMSPNENSKRAYYVLATHSQAITRMLFSPYRSPLDRFRDELNERWAPGVAPMNLGDGDMFSGLLRMLTDEVLAHEDKLERDHGFLPERLGYLAQFAVNAYLQTPEEGGELKLWDLSLSDEQYDRMRGASYGIEHHKLGPPDACIKPEPGDLIVFNSRKLHGIGKSVGGSRISMSSFMAYCGMNRPLYFWS
jgi:2OG-Fe(II) oxygenase superfamily